MAGLDPAAPGEFAPGPREEPALLVGEGSGDRPLGSGPVADPGGVEVVGSGNHCEVFAESEVLVEHLSVPRQLELEAVPVLDLHLGPERGDPGLQVSLVVGGVVEAKGPADLAQPGDRAGPGAEAGLRVVALEIPAPEEADAGIEVLADHQAFKLESVAVVGVIELAAVAQAGPVLVLVLRPGRVAPDVEVFVEPEARVHPVGEVAAQAARRVGPVGPHDPDSAPAQNVPLQPEHREIGLRGAGGQALAAAHGERPDAVVAELARHPGAAPDRHRLIAADPDPAAEEEDRHAARRPESPGRGGALGSLRGAEGEDALPFEKELALLRKEEAEPGQVDLLGIRLDLREVGVPGQVGGEPAGDSDLGVHADVGPVVPFEPPGVGANSGGVADGVRFHLHVPGAGRRFQAHQGGVGTDLGDRPDPEGGRELGEVGDFVLPADDPAEVDAPDLGAGSGVAEGLEREPQFGRPAALEARGPGIPDRGPVAVEVPLVGDEAVEEPAHRIQVEDEGVPPVVEGVEGDGEVLVEPDAPVVAPEFGGHDPVRPGVPAASGDVDRLVVEEDPDLGLFGGRRPFERLGLDEVADSGNLVVDRLV